LKAAEEPEVDVEVDPLAVAGDEPEEFLSPGDRIMADLEREDPDLFKQRPGQRMYEYAVKRMQIIQVRQEVEGSKMMDGWRREYLMMDDVKRFVEWQLAKADIDEQAKKRKR